MKVTVSVTVDVDPGAWAQEYDTSTDCVSIRNDVTNYVKSMVHDQLDSVGVLR